MQSMEVATRPENAGIRAKRYLNGLQFCIQQHAPITPEEKEIWGKRKFEGRRLFAPDQGGS